MVNKKRRQECDYEIELPKKKTEVVVRRYSEKRCSEKFHEIHRKTPQPATSLKKRLWHRCFPVNFVKLLRTPFFYRTPPADASEKNC